MRILHFADVHLDRPFIGMPREKARERRRELRDAFRRCLDAAQEHSADLVTIGGDLWEDEHVVADTRASVAEELRRLEPPVLMICGNHDPLLPGGNYRRTSWPPNVHLFESGKPSEYALDSVRVWGVSWTGGELTAAFLKTFKAPADGRTHLLLLHGTAQPVPYLAGESRNCPFDPAQVTRAGFRLCLSGHIHAARSEEGVVYPGSPEPLGWGELGRHCVALVEVAENGQVEVELIDVNRRRYAERELDCSGADSSAAIEARLGAELVDEDTGSLCLRLDLVGEVGPEAEIHIDALAAPHVDRYGALVLRDRTVPGYDVDGLADQPTAAGRFVRTLRERMDAAEADERETLELALLAGLRSLDRRKDILDVD